MDSRLQQVEALYHAALEQPRDSRGAWLSKACADSGVRRDVESLLAHNEKNGLLEQPVLRAAAPMMSRIRNSWRLTPGTRIGPYEITASIGAGGMAEVYRARDTKLNRDVAIKVLPEAFARDRERVARLYREAQLLASLSHPRIAAIYGLEENEDICGLALEFIDGETLADRIARAKMTVAEAVEIARQIAEALEAAHAKGVVHRDLKPANIKITPDGAVKVLDFGLAKIFASGIELPDLPTQAAVSTEQNTILGTVGYMSPEQARGKEVDKRTDIWAWGCVLYEMLTGRRTFHGDTTTDVIAKIASEEPDWTRLPEETPSSIRTLLRRALQKDPSKRLHDIADARIEIEDPSTSLRSATMPSRNRERFAWVAVAALLVVVSLAAVFLYRRPQENVVVARFTVSPPQKFFIRGGVPELSVSPDGRYLAFIAIEDGVRKLFIRAIDGVETRLMPGTEGADLPFWSPDSKFIGFNIGRDKLKKIAVDGKSPEVLSDTIGGSGTWGAAGDIVYGTLGKGLGLNRLSSAGGSSTEATSLSRQETDHWFPFFLPDGQHFLYKIRSSEPGATGIYVGSLGARSGERILDANSMAIYAEGHVLWVRNDRLMAQPFDTTRLELRGEPFLVAEGVANMSFSASNNGVLAYGGQPSIIGNQLTWFDREGHRLTGIGQESGFGLRLAPDRRRAVVMCNDPKIPGLSDLCLIEMSSGISSRFTFGSANEKDPVWSPDGRHLAFASNRNDAADLYVKDVGSDDEQPLLLLPGEQTVDDWNSQYIIFHERVGENPSVSAAYALPQFGDRQKVPLFKTPFEIGHLSLSPNGQWIAWNVNEATDSAIYVARFPSMTERRKASTNGGAQPRWRQDGKELYYLASDQKLMAIDVRMTADTIETGIPKILFQTEVGYTNIVSYQYDVDANGEKFFVTHPKDKDSVPPITVVINWLASLKKK